MVELAGVHTQGYIKRPYSENLFYFQFDSIYLMLSLLTTYSKFPSILLAIFRREIELLSVIITKLFLQVAVKN